ncbi:MAG: caspase family protein [Rubrivivax sp.]|jgi:hypothetical protein
MNPIVRSAHAAASARRLMSIAALAVMAATLATPARAEPQRHALIVAIGEYSDPAVPPLRGMRHDVASAGRIATALAVPPANVKLLRDHDATAAAIRYQIKTLTDRVAVGDRVFVYYSGHGTRSPDPDSGPAGGPGATTCTEGLLAADGRVLGNADLAEALAPLARKVDKLIVFYDACYSGGVASEAARTRSLRGAAGADEVITAKFTRLGTAPACAGASNLRTRSLTGELGQRRTWPDNVVHIAAARSDEVSFDSSYSGGYATTAWRDCLLGEARDIDGSGAITVAEVSACAQVRLDRLLTGLPGVAGQNLVVAGNASIVPLAMIAPAAAAAVSPATAAAPAAPAALGARPQAAAAPLATPMQVLAEVHAQRDQSRALEFRVAKPRLVAGRDVLAMEIRSPRAGHLYIALAHADGRGLTLLYPNALDEDNRVAAGALHRLPSPRWAVVAQPPAGTETLLAIVTDRPRPLNDLLLDPDSRASPFMRSLTDVRGRSVLQQVLLGQEAFGAALLEVETVMPGATPTAPSTAPR